jgi:hypothetical protein
MASTARGGRAWSGGSASVRWPPRWGGARPKAPNLPAYKSLTVGVKHIMSGHASTGGRELQSGIKTTFFDTMTQQEILAAVKHAYSNGRRVGTQYPYDKAAGGFVKKLKVHGPWQGGKVEMFVYATTKELETAYPLWKK